MEIKIGNEKETKEIELDKYAHSFDIEDAIDELTEKYNCTKEDLTVKLIVLDDDEYEAQSIDTLVLLPEYCKAEHELETFAAALTNYHTVERSLNALEFFYGKFDSRKDFAKECLAEHEWGGANSLISNNIDFNGVADDLEMEMDFVQYDGSLFVFLQH